MLQEEWNSSLLKNLFSKNLMKHIKIKKKFKFTFQIYSNFHILHRMVMNTDGFK